MERALKVILRICYLCKLCRVRFFIKRSMENHLPKCRKEYDERNSSRKKNLSDEVLNVEYGNHRLTYGNKLVKFQSQQSDEASQSKTNSYICTICKKSFSSAEQLKGHLRDHLRSFICKACGKSFTRAWSLKNHSLFYCKKRYVMCKVCNNIFVGVVLLREHCAVHFNDPEYICGVCGEKHGRHKCFKNKATEKGNIKKIRLAVHSSGKGITSPAILQEGTPQQGDFLSNVNPGTSQELSFRDPLVVTTTGNPEPMQKGVVSIWESSSVKDDSVGASEKTSLLIAFPNRRETWKGASLGEPSRTDDVDQPTVSVERSSMRFSSSINIANPQTSWEDASKDRPLQNEMIETGAYVEPGTIEVPPYIADDQRAFLFNERPSLETPSLTNNVIHPSFMECSSSTNIPQSMTGNREVFLKRISLKGLSSVIETAYPRINQEGSTQEKPPSKNEISEKGTSLKCGALKLPSSGSEVENQSACLKGLSLETPFLTGPVDHSPFLSRSPLKSPSQNKNDNRGVFIEEISSGGFPSLIKIPNLRLSHEGLSYEGPSQIEMSKIGSNPEPENLGAPSSVDEKDHSGIFSDGPLSFETSFSTKVANPSCVPGGSSSSNPFYNRRDNPQVCLEGTPIEKSQISTCSIDDSWIIFAKDSELETSLSFAISPSLHEVTNEEKPSSSETNHSSHFSEIYLPNNHMALDLPADMYCSGINLQNHDIGRVFEDIEMIEMPNEIHENKTGTVENEGDNVFPKWGYEMKPEAGNEAINNKYGTEYNESKMDSNLDFGNENPEDYYLDNFDLLKLLYG